MADTETHPAQTPADPPPRGKKARSALKIGGLLVVLVAGWVAGLKTHETVNLAKTSTWARETAAGFSSHLETWGRQTVASITQYLSGTSEPTVSSEAIPDRIKLINRVERSNHELRGQIDALRASSSAANSELANGLERLNSAIESTQKELLSKLEELQGRLDRVEGLALAAASKKVEPVSAAIDPLPEQINAAQPSMAPATVQAAPSLPSSAPEVKRITNWIVREVVNGTAILEGPKGLIGVTSGDVVPGVGRVESIARRGGRWVVATTKGLITPR
jgi:uncharacterized phage infection (PIP) family protein YhgE